MMATADKTSANTSTTNAPLKVLCVDDNYFIAEALRIKLSRTDGFQWIGALPSADTLVATVLRDRPALVILDMDMPGRSPLEALREVSERCSETRTVIFSGHVRAPLIEEALAAGAWGYVSKSDGEDALVRALRTVTSGEIALSSEANGAYRGTSHGPSMP